MAGYGFGEVTRLLYDAIWNEFCDWGVELAKVRLADESLAPEVREATWWALVEALDTYLRLLHPVMPFVTEALWAAIPHRAADPELLIVARWPGAGERDPAVEREVDALLELVRGLRNARAEAQVAATAWLPTEVVVPTALGADVRGAPPGDRAAGPGPPAGAAPDPRGASARAGTVRRPERDRRRSRGDRASADGRGRPGGGLARACPPRARARRRRDLAGGRASNGSPTRRSWPRRRRPSSTAPVPGRTS